MSAERVYRDAKLDDYKVTERSFILNSSGHTLTFTATDDLDGPLGELRSGPLCQTGAPPMFYVMLALGVDGGECIDEVWVSRDGEDALEAVTNAIEILRPIRERLIAIDRANRGAPPLTEVS